MEKGESKVKLARRQAALEVWVEMISAALASDSAGDKKQYLPVTGGWYVRTGHDYPVQAAHNDFEVPKGRSPRFFVLFSEFETIYLLVSSASHTYLHYQMAEKKKLAELLRLE